MTALFSSIMCKSYILKIHLFCSLLKCEQCKLVNNNRNLWTVINEFRRHFSCDTSSALPIMNLCFSFPNAFMQNNLMKVIFVCGGREMHTLLWWGKYNHTWKNNIEMYMK
jgi:hypothetical protein